MKSIEEIKWWCEHNIKTGITKDEDYYQSILDILNIEKRKGEHMVTKEQKVREIDESIYRVREIYDMAFDYNQNDKFRTELSLKCTDYLGYVWQTLCAIKDELIEDNE